MYAQRMERVATAVLYARIASMNGHRYKILRVCQAEYDVNRFKSFRLPQFPSLSSLMLQLTVSGSVARVCVRSRDWC
jgi:hypothetical protein